MDIELLLKAARQIGASDLHITANSPPVVRVNGKLVFINEPPLKDRLPVLAEKCTVLSGADTERMALRLFGRESLDKLLELGEHDFSYCLPGHGRFRINAYKQRGFISLAVRLINEHIPALEELGLPEVVKTLARLNRGLVLVTGPTGCGKSTTLAAMVELINTESRKHIITLEDPIEFLHENKKSIINQREIGRDSASFKTAIRAAMREDPDVILVGEMRDLETIAATITAAETGHLVLATLHTSSASQTVERIIDVFPPHQQQQIRIQLSNSIQGIICQQLLPNADGSGRVAAVEVMVATPAIRNIIRENKTYQIYSQLQTGLRYGMQTMERSIKDLLQKGLINKKDAAGIATEPAGVE
ncbi:tfp pilus assembly protein [Pelotomaculum thermopropionicum SI]|uniref:Tfp pilus assembly protein n=1 Tax=Pelotomaculum thermopropionicum (strain DSM 13744 / JCM 10971 / SI) TaxID=370438 RepID=A5D377_PELTS|nr:tfp pilus assembly protein [Pelotomaculum thermopropionicum SI]